jgi:hypothetical protein
MTDEHETPQADAVETEATIPDPVIPPPLNPKETPNNPMGLAVCKARLAERAHMVGYMRLVGDAGPESWAALFAPEFGAETAAKMAAVMGESLKEMAGLFDRGEHVNEHTALGLVWIDMAREDNPDAKRRLGLTLDEARVGFPGYPG